MGLFLMGPLAAAVAEFLRPEPPGHWSGHLASAAVSAGVAAAVATGTWLVLRRLPGYVGNLRVAQSLWATSYGDEAVGALGPSFADVESGHTVAGLGDGLVVVAGLAFAALLAVTRRVSPALALIGGVLAFFPPWIYPAPGPVFLLAWLCAARPWTDGRHDTTGLAAPGPQAAK